MPVLSLKVAGIRDETALIRRIVLTRSDGGALPGFEAGAHITLHAPGIGRRKYSLVNADPTPGVTSAPSRYVLGIRRDDAGQGGSKWAHGLKVGDIIEAEPPQNDFELAAGEGPVLLIAGGIGVTPLIAKAAHMKALGRPFRFIYAAKSMAEMAFLPEIQALAGDALTLHADDMAGTFLDIRALIDTLTHDEPVYICGPKPMIKAAMQEARALGWPAGRLRFELFFNAAAEAPPAPPAPDEGAFEVEIKSTGAVFKVPRDRTILAVLKEAGLDPLHDCDKGECGVCQVGVLSGVPDHRDSLLSEAERAAGKTMQICVSRAKSSRLVLDL
ncbi:MAG TPA: PDR/VanB family oxidoreductase [Beijerinckiaceae bacterium]|nr:PDR/VanB family oxidoreductase [Beijerinckiaceae bacterium]